MKMKKYIFVISYMLVAAATPATDTVSLQFDRSLLESSTGSPARYEFPDCESVPIGQNLSLPARSLLLPLSEGELVKSIHVVSLPGEELGGLIPVTDLRDDVTSDSPLYTSIVAERNNNSRLGFRPVEVLGEIRVGGHRYADLLVFPVTVNAEGRLYFHDSITVSISGRVVSSTELTPRADIYRAGRRDHPSGAASTGPEYLIVTSPALTKAMQALVKYKNETGFTTELRLIEDILPSYNGRDDAEKLREHLKDFFTAGGRYVLLAGDETVLPIRYAYHNNVSIVPGPGESQVCDLYFADLTGEWDADNDGVWGEKYADRPDIVPELLVGRLPVSTSREATNYIEKLIRYETDPGGDDRSYLERAFFFSSDQMRDYGEDGQHGVITQAYPEWFELDTTSAVELVSGVDPAPSNLSPAELNPVLTNGFGIVNVIAHGRSDGFVLKSSGYNNWPKTYILTDNEGTGHGNFASFSVADKPALYYSLACNNGSFDMDQPPMNHANPHMAQELIGSRGGAVGLVGYSRWGWISSSYILQKAFFDSLFAHPERPAVEALYASKAVLYYYTDLVYGLNYFGDPTLRVYTQVPDKPEIATKVDKYGLDVKVTIAGDPIADCDLILAEEGEIIGEFTTGSNGDLTISYPFEDTGEYRISVVPDEGTVTQIDFIPSLVTGIEDDPNNRLLPETYGLHQNYPNPFNPTTSISFDLPELSGIRLTVFNILGQVVTSLVDGRLPAGTHTVSWDGTGQAGQRVASGIYFYRLETEAWSEVKKMIMLK